MTSRALALLTSLTLAAGCGGPLPEAEDLAAPLDPGKADGIPAGTPRLAARYALALVSEITTRKRDSGEESTKGYHVSGIIDARQGGARVALDLSPCELRLPPIDDRTGTIDQSAIQAMAPISLPGTFKGDVLKTDPAALLLGVKLDDPVNAPLPTNGRDRGVIDQDQDEHPGMSVKALGFSVYFGARLVFALTSTPVTDGGGPVEELGGTAEVTQELAIYGDDIPFVSAKDRVAKAMADYEIVREGARFRAVRVGPSTTCATLPVLGL